ncbi:hypothetical protein OSTOST_04161 [Ostertagia ostertagi]
MTDSVQLQRDYERLRDSLPRLPSKDTLYAHIIDVFLKIHALRDPINALGKKIDTFRREEGSWHERTLELELLHTTAWKYEYQLLLYDSRLENLLTYPRLMIATNVMDETTWNEKMAQPVLDIDDNPVTTDPKQTQQEMRDYLDRLNKFHRRIELIEDELMNEDDTETLDFQKRVLLELQVIRQTLDQMDRSHGQPATSKEGQKHTSTVDRSLGGPVDLSYPDYQDSPQLDSYKTTEVAQNRAEETTDVPKLVDPDDSSGQEDPAEMREREALYIRRNIAFLEPIIEEEGENVANPEDKMVLNPEDQIVLVEEELVEIDEAAGEEEDHEQVRPPAEDVRVQQQEETEQALVARLLNEYRQAKQAKQDIYMMISALETQPRCRLRRYQQGVDRDSERTMPCIFCGEEGTHYSDACLTVRTGKVRNEIMDRDHRCKKCLDEWCARDNTCRKADETCFYCGSDSHNGCACELPDKSRELEERLQSLRNDCDHARMRIYRIGKRLERHGVRDFA